MKPRLREKHCAFIAAALVSPLRLACLTQQSMPRFTPFNRILYSGQENANLHPGSHKPRVTNPKSAGERVPNARPIANWRRRGRKEGAARKKIEHKTNVAKNRERRESESGCSLQHPFYRIEEMAAQGNWQIGIATRNAAIMVLKVISKRV